MEDVLPSVHLAEPHPALEALASELWSQRGARVWSTQNTLRVESHGALHEEAPLLDAEELADAERALIEDGILPGAAWWETHRERGIEWEAALRTATKYGWALLHLVETLRASPGPGGVLWSIAGGESVATEIDARWLACEFAERGLSHVAIDLSWPLSLEPMVEIDRDLVEKFTATWSRVAAMFAGAGCPVVLPHAAGKFRLIGEVSRSGHDPLLDLSGFAWLAFCRWIAGENGPLFREMLSRAQEAFVFVRPAQVLATSEDEVRSLPEVSDDRLAEVFLDDHRGRQLLHVTGATLWDDAVLGPRLAQTLNADRGEVEHLVGCEIAAHMAAWLERAGG
jgi:hypothetical protein